MEDIFVTNKNFGKCIVVCFFRDVAIVEIPNNYEKYVVTIGLSIKNNSWQQGYYCKNFKQAAEVFNKILEDFYMVSFLV